MAMADSHGLPIAVSTASANPAEVKLVEQTLKSVIVPIPLQSKLIADRAYDSDPLRQELHNQNIELVCPHRRGRKRPATQDGRKLRAYKQRWKMERLFAWLNNFRRLVVRWEYHIENWFLAILREERVA